MKQQNISKWMITMAAVMVIGLMGGCTKEGFGGDASLSGTVKHHNLPIPQATVYIKFGSKELPGTSGTDFDASTVADGAGEYSFENLQKGNYYLYSIGYDSSISQVVTGGVRVKVAEGQTNTQNLAVAE